MNLSEKHPKLLETWDFQKNKEDPYTEDIKIRNKYWWNCKNCNSLYDQTLSHKLNGRGCSYCAGRKVNETNSLLSLYPDIVKQWNYKKNTLGPDQYTWGSSKKVWWKC